jgi:hypothetical protein
MTKSRKVENPVRLRQDVVVARFGKAALVRQSDGACRLDGGNGSDCAEAREWFSLPGCKLGSTVYAFL